MNSTSDLVATMKRHVGYAIHWTKPLWSRFGISLVVSIACALVGVALADIFTDTILIRWFVGFLFALVGTSAYTRWSKRTSDSENGA